MCALGAGAWFWHAQGIRERALAAVVRHCRQEGVELLDDTVAFARFGLERDLRGRRRLGRRYRFEFTVTGERRHHGEVVMFGPRVGGIRLDAYAVETSPEAQQDLNKEAVREPGKVVMLDQWRRERS
ncbi:DUF3301 domain-containing protein [Stutzerimonas urumqiensis]